MRRAGVLLITSDRGLAGGYNANAIRTAEQLIARLRADGKEVGAVRRRPQGRRRTTGSATGRSRRAGPASPSSRRFADAREVGETLIEAFVAGADDGDGAPGPDGVQGVDELHIVHTAVQVADDADRRRRGSSRRWRSRSASGEPGLLPAYEFEPEAEALLDALLPKYINTRIYAALLDSAASESASRRRAMKSATDNADDMIKTLHARDELRAAGRDHPGDQ